MKKSRKKFWKKFKKKAWELLKYHPVSVGMILIMAILGLVYKEPGVILLAIVPVGFMGFFEFVIRLIIIQERYERVLKKNMKARRRMLGIKDDDED